VALLLSHRAINAFDELQRDLRFPVQRALDMIKRRRNAKLLGVDNQGWEQFSQITSFYDQYSYASVFAAATTQVFHPKTRANSEENLTRERLMVTGRRST
jgi:hypothetical protein